MFAAMAQLVERVLGKDATYPKTSRKKLTKITYAAMAQLVERVLGKDEVGGSNPPSSSKNRQVSTRSLSILLITYSLFTFH